MKKQLSSAIFMLFLLSFSANTQHGLSDQLETYVDVQAGVKEWKYRKK